MNCYQRSDYSRREGRSHRPFERCVSRHDTNKQVGEVSMQIVLASRGQSVNVMWQLESVIQFLESRQTWESVGQAA